MKKLVFYLLIIMVSITVIALVYRKPTSVNYKKQSSSQLQTKVKVDTTVIDLGEVKQYTSMRGKYTFHNIGNENFVVESVLTNCGCTGSDYPKKPISPNNSGEIILKYDSTRLGAFQSTGIVTSNATPNHTLLVLRGNVISNSNM